MSAADEPDVLGTWVEATQARVETWVGEHVPDFAEIDASLQDAVPEELAAWIGPSVALDVPEPDAADIEVRMRARVQMPSGSGVVWPVMDGAVADAVEDVQAVVERRVESRFARLGPSENTIRWPWVAAVALLAASVAALFWMQGGRLDEAGREGELEQAAQLVADDAEDVASTTPRAHRPLQRRRRSRGVPEVPPPDPGSPEAASSPEAAAPRPPVSRPEHRETRRARASGQAAQAPSLQALAAKAERLWHAGDRKGAQAALMEVVRRGGRTARVELAYADLFTLARQQGQRGARKRLYRGYLRRFPQGRLVDDARAGLCRVSTSTMKGACWADYLERHPAGNYRAEAQAAR